MHRAEIDQEHNRLILRWIDSLSISDVDRLQAEVMSLLPKLKPGFDCISESRSCSRCAAIAVNCVRSCCFWVALAC